MSNDNYTKLLSLLRELFQLDKPELDFGFYRVMHAKDVEITKFLDEDLLPQVKEVLAEVEDTGRAELEAQLEEAKAKAQEVGVEPDEAPEVVKLKERLEGESVDLDAIERDVYNLLHRFFSRYYYEGDFISQRRHNKNGAYAIPYDGEEVTLYWANKDQYYIKSSEDFRDYSFQLADGKEGEDPKRAHFRLRDAVEGEHGNVKEQESKERAFVLCEHDPIKEEDGELIIEFEFRPPRPSDGESDKAPNKKALREAAVERISELVGKEFKSWDPGLTRPHKLADGSESDKSVIEAQLERYTQKNSYDYFIHKDLGGFLRRELDFFLKAEVMQLDDIEEKSNVGVEQYLAKLKAIRRIGGKIIEFLAQLEDFQKKLWLKKKFVTETSWCITVSEISDDFYEAIAVNKDQVSEWIDLYGLGEETEDTPELGSVPFTNPPSVDFLQANPTLVIDTRHFDREFTERLLASFDDLDELTDGVLINSENFQALNLLQVRYREQVKCIYIDPPYNTRTDEFVYKDGFLHSSWATMMRDRVSLGRLFLNAQAAQFVSLDDGELAVFQQLLDDCFGRENRIQLNVWQKKYRPTGNAPIVSAHEYVIAYAKKYSELETYGIAPTAEQLEKYKNPDNDPRGRWRLDNSGEKTYLDDLLRRGRKPWTWWEWKDCGDYAKAATQVGDVLGAAKDSQAFSYPKPLGVIERVHQIANVNSLTLDYFAGSGTTGHAVINLNREDGGKRKFILVEMGDYFDTVLLPRIKKVTFSPEWKDGRPKRAATEEEAQRSPRIVKVLRLESYEDTLNNLVLRRDSAQEDLLEDPEAKKLREEYMLGYMLEVESRDSPSLLNQRAFIDPDKYELKVKPPGSDASALREVDLQETFNYLLGLRVVSQSTTDHFDATFERDGEDRLVVKEGKLKPSKKGKWWFRRSEGETDDGHKTLVIWRNRPGGDTAEGLEQDNAVLSAWFEKLALSSADSEFDQIYVNGDNNLENSRSTEDTWKVRMIEEEFLRLMFEGDE